jgi:hypothetical protein
MKICPNVQMSLVSGSGGVCIIGVSGRVFGFQIAVAQHRLKVRPIANTAWQALNLHQNVISSETELVADSGAQPSNLHSTKSCCRIQFLEMGRPGSQ